MGTAGTQIEEEEDGENGWRLQVCMRDSHFGVVAVALSNIDL